MCGIAGIVSKKGFYPSELQKLSGILKHRGPDDEGFFISGDKQQFLKGDETISSLQSLQHIASSSPISRLGLTHRRLSIIDLSAEGHQPMQDSNGSLVIVFNGEIYNYREIRSELQKLGCTFRYDNDTEVILQAYKQWGSECEAKFIGMWAFAIYDIKNKELFLSRDRFGIKPLYYYATEEYFAFASEIKALLSLEEVQSKALLKSSLEFICFGAQADPDKNLFAEIQQIPPSCHVRMNVSSFAMDIQKYYDLSESWQHVKSAGAEERFSELLSDSIRLHLRSDVEVGSALSGGLDSSTLVAIAADELRGKTFQTFTAAYHEKDTDESHFAKMVSDSRPNIKAQYVYPDANEYWIELEKLIWHQDLPIGSTSMFAQWEVMKLASHSKMKVLLDGQGADEILGGYYNFAGIYLISLLKQFRLGKFLHEYHSLKENFTPALNKAIGRAGFYFLPGALQKQLRSGKRLSYHFISGNHRAEAAKTKVPERGGCNYTEQSLLSLRFGLQDLLRYEDRNSMAFGIESRVPYLDHRLVEFCLSLHSDAKIKDGWTKFILRREADRLLPKEIAWRKDKMGFITPQEKWKTQLSPLLMEFINSTPIPEFIDRKYLLSLAKKSFSDPSHLSEFWRVISFIKWAQVFKVRFV